MERLTVPEIAKKLGTSVYVVRRAITRNNLHYNVSDIHKNAHLKFYKMFTEDELSIEEISEKTGFPNIRFTDDSLMNLNLAVNIID